MDSRDLDTLLAVLRAGSLSGAATRLGLAVSTVARRLDALEGALGLRLIERGAGGVRPTAAGTRIATLAGPVVDGAARLRRGAQALREGVREAPVRLSATDLVVSDVLAPALPAFFARHPAIAVTLQAQAGVVSLAAGAAELAIRMTRPEGNSLVARRLPDIRLGLFAGPAYLAGRDPAALDLRRERLLGYDDSYGRTPELAWLATAGLEAAVALRTGSTRALLTAAVAGAGVALLPAALALSAGLVEVPAPVPLRARTPWLLVHRDLRRDPAIRAVHGWVLATFAALPRH